MPKFKHWALATSVAVATMGGGIATFPVERTRRHEVA